MTLQGLALYIFFYLVQICNLYVLVVNSEITKLNSPFNPLTTRAMDWQQGKSFCEDNDLGHLAMIFNDEEQMFVRDNLFKHAKGFWLGLHDPYNDGNFVMENGQKPEYENWRPGQPNSRGTCVYIGEGGHWGTQPCTEKLYILCRKDSHLASPSNSDISKASRISAASSTLWQLATVSAYSTPLAYATTTSPDISTTLPPTVSGIQTKESSKTDTPNYEEKASNSALSVNWTTDILATSIVILAFMLKYNL